MAKIYGGAQGEILRVLQTEAEERQFPDPPAGAVATIDIDEDTNQAALVALDRDWNSHDCVGGVLRRNGVPVVINPPSAEYADRLQFDTLWDNLQTYRALPTPTAAQSAAALKVLIRVVWLMWRYLRRD